jgi:hypothetical protein
MIAPLPGPLDARSKLRRALGIGGAAFCVFLAIAIARLKARGQKRSRAQAAHARFWAKPVAWAIGGVF